MRTLTKVETSVGIEDGNCTMKHRANLKIPKS